MRARDTMRSASFSGLRVPDTRASQRRSFAGRMSQRVVSGLSFADGSFEEQRTGTVTGTIINTLCSVIGAGVLSLPLALYFSSVVVGLALLLCLSMFAAFSVYLLVVGCDATGRYSPTEVVAFALYPPQLWEEYLYQKGKEQAAAMSVPVAAGSAAQQQGNKDGRPSESRGSLDAATHDGVSSDGAAATAAGGGDAADSSRQHRRTSRRRREQQQQHGIDGAQPAASGEEVHPGTPRTSAYAGLRDAYARQEWQNRRRRRIATVVMEFIVFCSNYGTLVIYSKVIADSMPPVVSYITHSEGIFISKEFWLAAGGVVFFVLSCARNMEELKWTSLLGFLSILYIVIAILYRYHTQHVRDYPHVDPAKYGTINWMHLSVKVLQTVSTFGLAFSYHYNVPYLYKELQDRRPRRMMESIAVAFPIIIACYALTGVFGYLTFGKEVANKKVGGNIVSNYPINDLIMNIGRLGLFAHFACVFPVVSICTRRGMHRLTMVALTWSEQSSLMREAAVAAGAQLTGAEGGEASSDSDGGQPGETSPLLHTTAGGATASSPLPGYENFSSSSPQQHTSSILSASPPASASATTGQAYNSLSDSSNNEDDERNRFTFGGGGSPPGTVDVDRDVGSPDLTTTLAIVIEAAFLVFTTVLIAGTVSGIDFVIHIVGTLFSVFIVMVAPGIVGWCVFSPSGPFGSAAAAAAAYGTQEQQGGGGGVGGTVRSSDVAVNGAASRYRFIRLKQAMCLVNIVLGVCITGIGIAVLVYDTTRGARMPTF